MSHLNNDSLSGYGKILKNHILLLANSDINVPLYQNKLHESTDNETTEYTMNSPKLDDKDYNKEEDTLNDPYSNFFNCLVENDFFLSMNKINKIINNNEIKYICYGNKLNFINLVKFFSFKIVRLITVLTTQSYDDVDKFAENTETFLKSIRFLTKLMPIFFEVCYNESDDDSELYFTEDEIFWNANTSETYQDLNNPTQNATVRAPESILSFDKFNKSPVSSKDESEKSISSLNVEINFKAKQNPDEFSTQPNWFLDGVAQKNNLPLGISLLSALLKCLFMEGFTLPLSSAASMGNISFHLWNNDALDLHNKDGNYSKMPNPTLDSNRLEIMDLLQVLFSNTLYSSKKIDNKFLASWCCSMPEYLSVYLINSLLNNFTDENNILAKSNITTNKAVYNPNFAYPQEYHVVKFKSFNSHQGNNANRMSLLKQNFTMNNELESTYRTAEAFTSQSSNFLPNLSNYQEEVLTIEESSKLRENYLKTSRNILLLYFTFDPNAISQNTKLQIANSTSDINDYNNVCLRSFSSINTLSDFKKILVSIVKVLKLPIDMAIEDDNKIFNLNNKSGSSFLDIFTKSTTSSSGSESKNEAASDKSKDDSSQSDNMTEIPLISQNITSVLLIFNKMLESNGFFETHVLEIYSNKIFFILLFYLKKYHQNLHANSKFMYTLENLMLRITSNPIFSLRSMKFLNSDYYTEKVPKLLKLLDMDLNIATETHRDFFIKHICNIILKSVEMNHAPKINHYHMLNNLLLATPQHLSQEQRGNVCQLLEMEQRNENSVLGNFTSGINFLTSKKIIIVIFSFIKNREYLHTFSVDRNKNYRTQLEKTSMDQLKSRDSFSMSSESSTNSYTYTANNSSVCDSLFSDTNNALMYEATTGAIDINPVSKIPYIFTVACKWECVSVMLKTITNVVSQYFDDYANLIFLLGKYKNILYELSRAIAILDKDIGNELQPLMLKFLPPGVSKKSIYSTSSLNIPFDIALHSYPTVLDEVLSIDDDSMNDFDPMPLNVIKKNSIASISSEPIEDMFYESGNNNISFIDSDNSSILDLTTGRRILYSSGSLLSQNEDDKGSLSLNTGNTNKQVMVKESVNDFFMPHYYNNATYNAVSCIRPPGMTKKRIKKMIVKNSDNFRQSITTANQNNKGFWFLGSRYLMYLITFAHKVSDVIGAGNFEGSQGEAQTKLLVKKILRERQNIMNDKRVAGALPLEVTYYNHELYIFPRTDYNPLGYQFLQTLVWTEIFNNNSVDYKYFSEEISGNADLLYNLNTSHTSVLSVDEGNTTPSSPMLERWNSNNSLSKVESNASGASYHSSLNTNTHSSKDIHLRVMSGGSDSYNGSIMEQIKYSTFLIESVGTKSKDLKFVVSSGLSQSLKWYNTNVKMFPIKKTESNEFSLIDYTSNFLNKFKFRNSIAIKTPEEVAADEIKRVYTPRSSISSMPSRK